VKVRVFAIGLILIELLILSIHVLRTTKGKIIFEVTMFPTKALVFQLLILLDELLKYSHHLVG